MNSYFNEELVDMLIVYGAANCNGLAALRLYRRRHDNGRNPHYTTFASVNSSITSSAPMCVLNHLQTFSCGFKNFRTVRRRRKKL
ncbi:hypothetical protein TNCV_893721 [Trichonephila clavipes]|nr:hypothetical protein TNCV_893721 [Trichonephila clavipes]